MALFLDLRLWGVMFLALVAVIVISVIYHVSIGYDDSDPQGPKG